MRRFKILLEKEFKHIFRDSFMPKLIFLIPILQLLILPFAADFEMKNIRLAVMDRDMTPHSRLLSKKIASSKYFMAENFEGGHDAALRQIENDGFDALLEIPEGFEKDLRVFKNARVLVEVNSVNGTKGGIGAGYLGEIITAFCEDISGEFAFQNAKLPEIEMRAENRFNIFLNYKAFIVPGIVVFLISIIAGLLAAVNIVREKEEGTMEQMNVAPISKLTFIASKIVPFWIIGLVIMTFGMIIAWLVYGLVPEGDILIPYAFAAVYLTAFCAFGLIVSNHSQTVQQALLTFIFFIMIFLLMSGIFTPISSMPEWAQKMTLLNPVRYFAEVIRAVYLKGAGWEDLKWHFAVISVFALVINAYAVASFKRSVN